MATVVDELVTKFRAEDNFGSAAGNISRSMQRINRSIDSFHTSGARLAGAFQGMATSIAALAAVPVAIAGYSITRAAQFESLTLALENIEGTADRASRSLERLREIARGPGLGVTEAIETYMGLRRGGIDMEGAMRLTRELGNMVARSGGGREVLGRAGLALSQIAMTEFLQGDELRQLAEAGIPAYAIVKEMFGTANTEQLKKAGVTSRQVLDALLSRMEQMPRVAGGARNAWENLLDSIDQAAIQFGGPLMSLFTGPGGQVGSGLDSLTSSGFFERLGQATADALAPAFAMVESGASTLQEQLIRLAGNAVTVGAAFTNIALNISDVTSGLTRFWEWLNTPLFGPDAGKSPTQLAQESGDYAPNPAEIGQKFAEAELERLALIEARRAKGMAMPGGATVADADLGSALPAVAQTTKVLDKIERNTRPLLDFQQYALGGGELGRMGITTTEIAGLKGSRGGGGKLEKAVDMFRAAVIDEIGQAMRQGRRLGVS